CEDTWVGSSVVIASSVIAPPAHSSFLRWGDSSGDEAFWGLISERLSSERPDPRPDPDRLDGRVTGRDNARRDAGGCDIGCLQKSVINTSIVHLNYN
ncbi:MAG: hypothetical protein AAGJ69_09255, partial [Cyanobacteria bacterium J06559_1]